MNILNFELFPSNYEPENTVEFRGRFSDVDADKLRGGYYTTPKLASWLSSWAITDKNQTVLEPSCGDGSFLEAAVDRLLELQVNKHDITQQLTGIEFNTTEALKASHRIKTKLNTPKTTIVINSDFFE